MAYFHKDGTRPDDGSIFVFGSNLAGYHGNGAAQAAAAHYNAKWGVGEGPMGQAYAIPTMDKDFHRRPLDDVADSIQLFLAYARSNGDLQFFVTRVGCGIAGFDDATIAPLFANAPDNCSLADSWRDLLDASL